MGRGRIVHDLAWIVTFQKDLDAMDGKRGRPFQYADGMPLLGGPSAVDSGRHRDASTGLLHHLAEDRQDGRERRRERWKVRKGWLKVRLLTDVETNRILSYAVTDEHTGDAGMLAAAGRTRRWPTATA